MARLFASASSQYLQIDQAAIGAYPITMMCHFMPGVLLTTKTLMFVGDKDATNDFISLQHFSTDVVRAFSYGTSVASAVTSTTTPSINVWHHAAGVWNGAASRTAYLDAGGKVTETTAVSAIAGYDRTAIGASRDSSPGAYASARIADAGIWNVALTDAEVAAHAAGVPAYLIRPESLVAYWPLDGIESPEPDLSGNANNLTVTGATKANHAPVSILYPRSYIEEVAAGGTTVSATTAGITTATFKAGVNAKKAITSTTAAISSATYQAAITQGADTNISASTAAITTATYAATVNARKAITSTTAAISLATYQADIVTGTNITATTASITSTAYAASITNIINWDISASTASLVTTPYQATITNITGLWTEQTKDTTGWTELTLDTTNWTEQ